MPRKIRTVTTSVVISGVTFPILSWTATLANQGAMGTASARGSRGDLVDFGLDIIAASQTQNGATLDIYCGYDGASKLVFSGVVDSVEMDWDEDTFEVKGRDHSASLADGKQTIADLKYRNQTVAQIVQQIAQKFGFATQITDPGIMAGPLVNGENSYNPHPQSYWSLLQSLAEKCGYECYLLPNQNLYFGPEQQQGTITVNYGAPAGSGAVNPGWGLKVTYNPRNNSNITVKALSVDAQKVQTVTATAKANPLSIGKGRKTNTSFAGNTKIKYPSSGSGNSSPAKSTYYIRCPGLTPDQAQARCQAMADNLAKRQIILELNIEGNLDVVIHSNVNLIETTIDLYGFAGVDLSVASVTHSYSVPSAGATNSGGFVTSFKALAQIEAA